MRNSILRLSMLVVMLVLAFSVNAQRAGYYDYSYPWTFGINGGLAWQQSDVNGGAGYGLGIDLAKRIKGEQGNWFALDARGRFSILRHYGQGYDRVYNLSDYSALQPFQNVGYTFHNHSTTIGELDFEGVITLNKLREETGWAVQFFGGLGIGLYDVATDLDNGVDFYDYSTIDTTRRAGIIRGDIRGIRNRTYESSASGFENAIRGTIMPALGIGVGYQLTPRFSLGLEHKTTWALADNLDGVIDYSSQRPDDLHHYTSLYLRWTLGGDQGYAPIIDVTAPNRSPYPVTATTGTVRANIQHVTRRNDLRVSLNGQTVDYFDFNTTTGEFFLTVPLVNGQNTVYIYAQNAYGSDEENVVFVYEYIPPPPTPAPVVKITQPLNNPFSTNNNAVEVEANVANVNSRNNIQFTVNGNIINDYSFYNNRVIATVNLQNGNNYIEITGTNNSGQASDNCTIVYNQQRLPKITFLSPSTSPYTVNDDSYSIRARIDNVDNARNIDFRVNGKSELFSFKNGVLGSLIDLNTGTNIIEISAYNNDGTDNASTTIINEQEIPVQFPSVAITTPNQNPHVSPNANISVKVKTNNVSFSNQITFRVNGSDKVFQFNSFDGSINANINLVEGNNRVEVSVNTATGQASDFVNIVYKEQTTPMPTPPRVVIIKPNTNPYVSTVNSVTITASVTDVADRNGIRFMFNNKPSPVFTYNPATNQFQATVILQQGNNTFEIIAENNDGTNRAGGSIVFKPQSFPPVITMTNPTSSPFTASNAVITVSARIQYVRSRNDIQVTINGQSYSGFNFSGETFTMPMDIAKEGSTVVITATNADGQDQETVVINLPKPKVPVVTFTNPTSSPYNSRNDNFNVRGTATNVNSKNDVTVKINGQATSNFNFSNGDFSIPVVLNDGNNTVEVTARNNDGSDSKSVVLQYSKPKQPPVINMITPAKSPYTATAQTINVRATILNVSNRNDIVVTLNGQRYTGFTLNGTAFSLPIDIPNNGVTVVIIAKNNDGQVQETVVINYKKLTPVVTFTNPTSSPFRSKSENFTVRGTIEHVRLKSDVTVKINGQATNNFNFLNGNFAVAVILKDGNNTVEVTARNNDGSDSKSIILQYSKPKQPPVINMITPAKSPYTATAQTINVRATILNVSNRNDIVVTLNGQRYTGFTLNGTAFSLPIDIPNNGVTVVIIAKNNDGQDQENIRINYSAPVPKPTLTVRVPQKSVVNTTKATENLTVVATNTTGKNQISIRINNVNFTNFNYNNGVVTAQLPLNIGRNVVTIVVQTNGGKATSTLTFNRSRGGTGSAGSTGGTVNIAKPTVTFTTPSRGASVVSSPTLNIQAKVTDVASNENISVKVNGKPIRNVAFNAKNGLVTCTSTLQNGNNTIVIIARNAKGVTTQSTTIILKAGSNTRPNGRTGN